MLRRQAQGPYFRPFGNSDIILVHNDDDDDEIDGDDDEDVVDNEFIIPRSTTEMPTTVSTRRSGTGSDDASLLPPRRQSPEGREADFVDGGVAYASNVVSASNVASVAVKSFSALPAHGLTVMADCGGKRRDSADDASTQDGAAGCNFAGVFRSSTTYWVGDHVSGTELL